MELNLNFKTIDCCSCNFIFAVPASVKARWRNDHTSFYCPSCRTSQSYTQNNEAEEHKAQADKFKKLYEEKLECCIDLGEEVAHQYRRVNGYKGALTKEKNKSTSNNRRNLN